MNNALLSRGVSDETRFVEDAVSDVRRFLQKSSAFDELAEVWEECRHANWDGYGALPVSQDALRNAYVLLETLPLGFPGPSISADPNGCLSVEWYRNSRRVLSMAVTPDGLLHYAAILGPNKTCGTEIFFGDLPVAIVELIRRVYS